MIRCLVRDQQKGDAVTKVSSNVQAVIGDLDDAELVKKEARQADVVFSRYDSCGAAIELTGKISQVLVMK